VSSGEGIKSFVHRTSIINNI